MSTTISLSGQTFGRLTVIKRSRSHAYGKSIPAYWITRCQCGRLKEVRGSHLRSGNVRSCGCLTIDVMTRRSTKHGEYDGQKWSPEYLAWASMKARCLNKKSRAYKSYGGRGIKIAEEWLESPMAFIRHVGRRPSQAHSIERKNNDGDYKPGNVRWATDKEQQRNRRVNLLMTIDGVTRCAAEWAEIASAPAHRIERRVKAGWNHKDAVFAPVTKRQDCRASHKLHVLPGR